MIFLPVRSLRKNLIDKLFGKSFPTYSAPLSIGRIGFKDYAVRVQLCYEYWRPIRMPWLVRSKRLVRVVTPYDHKAPRLVYSANWSMLEVAQMFYDEVALVMVDGYQEFILNGRPPTFMPV